MGIVALVHVDRALSQGLAASQLLQGELFVDVSDAAQLLESDERSEPLDAVLIGPGCPQPVRAAQRLHAIQEDVPVLSCSAPGAYQQLKHAVLFAPLLRPDVTCVPSEETLVSSYRMLFNAFGGAGAYGQVSVRQTRHSRIECLSGRPRSAMWTVCWRQLP